VPAKKILFLVGDFAEDYEVMVPFETLTAVGHLEVSRRGLPSALSARWRRRSAQRGAMESPGLLGAIGAERRRGRLIERPPRLQCPVPNGGDSVSCEKTVSKDARSTLVEP
jgi:putative intracellular protease/amidase